MTEEDFDIYEFRNAEAWDDEALVDSYIEQLMEFFADSPEALPLAEQEEHLSLSWVYTFLDYTMVYLRVSPPDMTADDLREILFELFPRQASTPEGFDGESVVRELIAFWHFLKREFGLKNADACLAALDDMAAARLNKAMNNPANHGTAKSMVMMGAARGFDVSDEEDFDRSVMTYDQELPQGEGALSEAEMSVPLPGEGDFPPDFGRSHSQRSREADKERRKRKLAKSSRKKNRRK